MGCPPDRGESGLYTVPYDGAMNHIRNGAKFGAASAAVLALVIGAASPALAAEPVIDGDGVVTIGSAHWQFNEYGLAYGWDAADVYSSSGYIYYPAEFYADDYAYCGTGVEDAVVTVESNGDMTIACPAGPFAATGLTLAINFRLYAESATGYLARQYTTISNNTEAPIDVSEDFLSYYYDGYTGTQGTPGFYTSLGGNTVTANDTGYVSHKPSGASVVETEVWALTGSAPDSGIVADDDPSVRYTDDSLFEPGETKNFVTYTNMVIPATQDTAGAAAAFELAGQQTGEYGEFTGRLVAGLPEGLTVVGWGVTPTTPEPVNPVVPAAPVLANTGSDASGLLIFGFGALLVAAAGVVLVRRTRAQA